MTYTADGRFHFITVRTSVPKYASNDPSRPSPEEAMAVASGVVAYTGTYTVDESTKTAHLNIETSSVPKKTKACLIALVVRSPAGRAMAAIEGTADIPPTCCIGVPALQVNLPLDSLRFAPLRRAQAEPKFP